MANRISEFLEKIDKSPYWLARETKLSHGTIYNLINNKVPVDRMSVRTANIIATVLNVQQDDLRPVDEASRPFRMGSERDNTGLN